VRAKACSNRSRPLTQVILPKNRISGRSRARLDVVGGLRAGSLSTSSAPFGTVATWWR